MKKRDIHIYRVRAHFSILSPILKKIANYLTVKKIVLTHEDLLGNIWVGNKLIHLFYNEIYIDIKDKISSIDDIDCKLLGTEYHYASKKILSLYIQDIIQDLLLIQWIREQKEQTFVVFGWYNELRLASRIYFGDHQLSLKKHYYINSLLNIFTAFVFLGYFIIWLVRHIDNGGNNKKHFLLAADAHMFWLYPLYQSLAGKRENLLYYHRNGEKERSKISKKYNQTSDDQCLVTLNNAYQIMKFVFNDITKIYQLCWRVENGLFYKLVRCVVKRGIYRAFFNHYKIKIFFMVDDYISDHVVRNIELRRIGGISVSTNHGLPYAIYGGVQWLYVDFDYYFSYGSYLYDKYYHNTWSPNVRCVPVGSLAINAEQLAKSKSCVRNNDIVFFILPIKELDELLSGLIWLANELRNMRVLIKPKPIHLQNTTFNSRNLSILEKAPANLKLILETDTSPFFNNKPYVLNTDFWGKVNKRDLTYELMIRSKYAIGTFSTTLAEAVQLGCKAFMIDWYKNLKHIYYRKFPNMCVDDFKELVKRITRIEAGEEIYDFAELNKLININVTDPVTTIKKEFNFIDWGV